MISTKKRGKVEVHKVDFNNVEFNLVELCTRHAYLPPQL